MRAGHGTSPKTSRRCRAWCPLSPAPPHSGESCPLSSIQATAPPDRVPRQREHFCPKLLADSGGGMIPPWDAREPPTPDLFSTDSSRRYFIANRAHTCHTANSRCVLAATCAAEEPAYSCQALERRRIGLAPRGNPRGNGAARQIGPATDQTTKPSARTSKSSSGRQVEAAPLSLTRGQINAVRAAFKAGIKPRLIARQFGISQSDVRKVLASNAGG